MRYVLCLMTFMSALTIVSHAAPGDSNRLVDIYGNVEFTLFPPHNEQDLGLRGFTPEWPTGEGYAWFGDAFPRYGVEADVSLVLRKFNKVFVFINPYLPLGHTIPQIDYGWSPKPIGVRLHFGIGYHLTNHLDLIIQHHSWEFFGKYRNVLVAEGPYGVWNGITTRYHFDTRPH